MHIRLCSNPVRSYAVAATIAACAVAASASPVVEPAAAHGGSKHAAPAALSGASLATKATAAAIDPARDILSTYSLGAGVVFKLAIPTVDEFGRTHVVVPNPRGGAPMEIMLRSHSVRAADFTVVAFDAKGRATAAELPESHTVRGGIIGDPTARVAGSLADGRLTLSVRFEDGRRYFVDSLAYSVAGVAMNDHIVYDTADRLEIDAHCGADADHDVGGVFGEGGTAGGGDGGVAGGLCDAQLVVDCDFPYYTATGGTVDLTATRVETIINILNDQYEPQVGIRHLLTGIVVRTSAAADPYVSNTLCVAGDLLGEVSTYWGNVQGGVFPGITRDMVHMFTGRSNPGSSTVGCAWVGDVCATPTDYVSHGVSRAAFTANTAFITDLVAHEMGHNWGATHCTCSSPPSTMNPFLTGSNTFVGSPSIGEINTWRSGHSSCLDCSGAANDGCGDPNAGSAWAAHVSRFAYQSSCCARVCAVDSYCCNNQWDSICVNEALATCSPCGQPGAGSPYTAHPTPGCNDTTCCATICSRDPFCCDSNWDSACASQSESLCRSGLTCAEARLINAGIPESLSFTTSNDATPSDESTCGTNDVFATWMRYRPSCSGMSTLSICTEFAEGQVNIAAYSSCGGTQIACSATDTGCGFGNGGVQIRFAALQNQSYWIRISADNSGRVAGTLSIACSAVCGSGASGTSCAAASSSPGCSDASCCVSVCAFDPYCCNSMWDSICANEARTTCYRLGDINYDGVVNAADLGTLLNSWGFPGQTDINGDGQTNAADLSILLSNWG